jgi:hypothetical protein
MVPTISSEDDDDDVVERLIWRVESGEVEGNGGKHPLDMGRRRTLKNIENHATLPLECVIQTVEEG